MFQQKLFSLGGFHMKSAGFHLKSAGFHTDFMKSARFHVKSTQNLINSDVSTKTLQFGWISHEICQISYGFHEIQWISFGFHEIRQILYGFHEIQQISYGFHEIRRISCEIERPLARNCNPMFSLFINFVVNVYLVQTFLLEIDFKGSITQNFRKHNGNFGIIMKQLCDRMSAEREVTPQCLHPQDPPHSTPA